MHKNQANRAVIARRIAPVAPVTGLSMLRTSDAARRTRMADIREVRKVERRRKAPRMTATQRDSQGKRSDWSKPALLGYRNMVTTHEQRWDQTVNNQNQG